MVFRIKCLHEKEMKRLLESRKVLATNSALPSPDAKINLLKHLSSVWAAAVR